MAHEVLANELVIDQEATDFGTPVDEHSLVTGDGAVTAKTTFGEWRAKR